MSLCDNCKNKRDTWSDELKEDGYVGCIILYQDESRIHEVVGVVVGTGWIKNGNGICTNNMLITKDIHKCNYYEEYIK